MIIPISIFNVQVKITELDWQEKYYLPQETGNYSVAGFRMLMERKVSQYVITYYLPSGLFVVVSWASFLIPSDDIQVTNIFLFFTKVSKYKFFLRMYLMTNRNYRLINTFQGRMALLVTLFLVLVNIFNAITTNSPKADGLNALQVFNVLFCCNQVAASDFINNELLVISNNNV